MKFKVILISLFIFFAIAILSDNTQKPNFANIDIQQRAKLEEIYTLMTAKEYDLALPIISVTLQRQLAAQPLNKPALAWLYDMKAQVMAARYHFHYAIEAITQASQQKDDVRYNKLKASWQRRIDDTQNERLLKTSYNSGRDAGLSQSLTNKINIAYIYIDDNRNSKWSGKQRLENQASVDRVLNWYQKQAKYYAIDNLEFKVRYFVVNSPRGVGKQWLRRPSSFHQIMNGLIKRLRFRDLNEFIEYIAGRDTKTQVALVFHSNFEGRSFAMSCPAKTQLNQCKYEYVMLTEKMNNRRHAWVLPQVQAHEVLHLFGAKDLYNIKKSKNYAVTDVMNYYSKDIKYATIDPISAWAIGWHKQPSPPFKIEN